MIKLRGYQTEAITAIRTKWAEGVRRPATVLPTGAGKTVVFAALAQEMRTLGVRSLILAHRDELITQAVDKIGAVAPELAVGVVKAERVEVDDVDVVVASVQSLAGMHGAGRVSAIKVRHKPRLVIVDEAHHAVADSYMAVLRTLGCFSEDLNVGAYALGVTATLGRSDRVALGQVWQEVAYTRSVIDMIKEGYLVNARGIRVRIDGLDLSKVRRARGDWSDGALSSAMHDAMAPKAIVRAWAEHAGDRRTIVFAPDVAMAYELAQEYRDQGITAEAIDGAMVLADRRAVLARFAHGETQVICNCMILTEGFDAPWCDCVVIARPTSSSSLFVQMAGRGLRPYPGKADCVIMDVAGVTGRHKLASIVDLTGADRVEELPPELAEYDELDLIELDELLTEGGSMPRPELHDGPLVHEIVDLFGLSHEAWLRTRKGVWFLPYSPPGTRVGALVFVAPTADPGVCSVGVVPQYGGGGEWLRERVDLGMAMAIGEAHALGGTKALVHKNAPWRRSTELSTQQVSMAARLDISVHEGMTRGELSDAISVALATQRLDRMPCMISVSLDGYW